MNGSRALSFARTPVDLATGHARDAPMVRRPPIEALRPWVSQLWATDAVDTPGRAGLVEHALPTGETHLVFRIGGDALQLRDPGDTTWRTADRMLIGGPRSRYYARRPGHGAVVGAMLRPGACRTLFGVPAGEFADRHVALADLWDDAAVVVHQRLAEAATSWQRVDLLESLLATRLAGARRPDPFVGHALVALGAAVPVGRLVASSGLTHRAFIARFRDAVGLAPKAQARVLRLQRTLRLMTAAGAGDGADIAHDGGFADQAHLCREFAELAGLRPGDYLRSAPARINHVVVGDRD